MAIETEFVFLQPADVLVVRTTAYMHQGQRNSIIADIKGQLGADAKVIVLDGGLDLQVLRPAAPTVVQEEAKPAQPARILIEEVARDYESYRRLGAAPDQVAVVDMLRKEFDSADSEKRAGRGRLWYVIERARELDIQDEAAAAAEAGDVHELPQYRWVHKASLVGDQASFAISHDEKTDHYAILEENLTEEQRAQCASYAGRPGAC